MEIKETILKSGKVKKTVIFAWEYKGYEDNKDFTITLYRDGDYCFEILTPKPEIVVSTRKGELRKKKQKPIHRYYAVDDQREFNKEKELGKAILEKFR